MPKPKIGRVTAIYEDGSYHCVDVELDSGSTVTSSQSIDKGGIWLNKHRAVKEGQRVAVAEREYQGNTYWSIDFKATGNLTDTNGAPQTQHAETALTLKEWTEAAGWILTSACEALRASLNEGTEINQEAATKYATTIFIAVAGNSGTLASLHNQKPFRPPNEATAALHEEFDLEMQDELPF